MGEVVEDQGSTPFTDNYGIATNRFKSIVDEHISNMIVTDEEIRETERLTRGQNKKIFTGSFEFWQSS